MRYGQAKAFMCMAILYGGCVGELPSVTDVTDLRVLAIRADPPQLLDDPIPEEVRFTALVVDPREENLGANVIELQWSFCPVDSDQACLDYEELMEEALGTVSATPAGLSDETFPPICEATLLPYVVDLLRFQEFFSLLGSRAHWDAYRDVVVADEFVLQREPSAEEVGLSLENIEFLPGLSADLQECNGMPAPPGIADLPARISDLHLFQFLYNPVGAMLGSNPSVSLRAKVGDETLRATKRLPLTFRNPSTPITLLRLFAPTVEIPLARVFCPAGTVPKKAVELGCVLLKRRQVNQNPVFNAIETAFGKGADTPFEPWIRFVDGVMEEAPELRLAAGDKLRLLPVLSDDSVEVYETIHADPENFSLSVRESEEQISVAWFSTAGDWQEDTTYTKNTKTLDNRFTAPSEVPAVDGGLVHVWLVVRDNRGGTTWQHITIQVVPGLR